MESWETIMLVGGIAVVCAAVLPRRAASSGGSKSGDNQTVRNMETALEQFMENMEADNREIASLVSKSSQEAQVQAAKRDERIEQLEKRCVELERALAVQAKAVAASVSQSAAYNEATRPAAAQQPIAPPVVSLSIAAQQLAEQAQSPENFLEADRQPPSIRSRYAELFEMYQTGKSIDAIAKKLGRNKGEIQLILQLAKQEEAARNE